MKYLQVDVKQITLINLSYRTWLRTFTSKTVTLKRVNSRQKDDLYDHMEILFWVTISSLTYGYFMYQQSLLVNLNYENGKLDNSHLIKELHYLQHLTKK